MILVAGATGVLGGLICQRLRDRGDAVRALVRASSDPDKQERLRALGVELAEGDLRDRASLDAACRGVDTVVSTVSMIVTAKPGDSFEATDDAGTRALVDAAKSAGVGHFVYVSFDCEAFPDSPLVAAKRSVEEYLRASGVPYTILKPGPFMEVWLGPMLGVDAAAGTAKIFGSGERPVPYLPQFLDCRNGKVWPNERPGLGVTVDEKQLTFVEAMTEAAPGPTHRRPDGSLSHW
jgi:NADH dehydrogenase